MKTTFSALTAVLFLMLLAFVPAFAQSGSDELEPNDAPELADIESGYVIHGNIGLDGDTEDWFLLSGQEGAYPIFTMSFDDEAVEVDWEVWSGDVVVGSSMDYGSPESLFCEIPGTCTIHVWLWEGQGEYQIEIEP